MPAWISGLLVALLLVGEETAAQGADRSDRSDPAPRIEVVFVVDTTGSMSGLLQAAKQQIWSIATDLACAKPTPELRLGLLAYRDRGDSYVTRRFDLTTDMDALYAELVGLRADGGGDEPESVNQALYEAVTDIGWSADPQTYRAIFLLGDAPPHMNYAQDVPYPRSCELAHGRGIAVNSIQCGQIKATTPVWTEIARLGDGAFCHLDRSGDAPVIATPWDKGIAAMAKQLDATRLPYGTDAERAAFAERRELAERSYDRDSLAVQASRGSFNATAAGRTNLYGAKDLLADLRSGHAKLDEIPDASLPEPLRSMKPAERSAYLERQAKLREDLELTLQSAAAERRDYLAKELAKRGAGDNSLSAGIFAAIQPQAARHGFELGRCTSSAR